MTRSEWIIGIDEVGRGALAGPVAVAAVAIRANANFKIGEGEPPLRDSKQLSPKNRERWLCNLKQHPGVRHALARVYPRGIERMNISKAANVAAARALGRLLARNPGINRRNTAVFLDGGLFVGNGKRRDFSAKTVIKGDQTIPAVALASIVAKVGRDRFMRRLGKRYPAYGFEVHKGYGTSAHRAAIKKRGPCAMHRLTFIGMGDRIGVRRV